METVNLVVGSKPSTCNHSLAGWSSIAGSAGLKPWWRDGGCHVAIDLGYPARGLTYIRHIKTAETYAGGRIVVPETARDKVAAQQFVIVAVGGYERCEDEDCERQHTVAGEHAHQLAAGDWVLVRNRSWLATPCPDTYVCRWDAILGKFVER
jgi:co-chaperonin GroES (HSP10)